MTDEEAEQIRCRARVEMEPILEKYRSRLGQLTDEDVEELQCLALRSQIIAELLENALLQKGRIAPVNLHPDDPVN